MSNQTVTAELRVRAIDRRGTLVGSGCANTPTPAQPPVRRRSDMADANRTVCILCGRSGTRGFAVSSGNPDLRPGQTTWKCANYEACERRQRTANPWQCDLHPGTWYGSVKRPECPLCAQNFAALDAMLDAALDGDSDA